VPSFVQKLGVIAVFSQLSTAKIKQLWRIMNAIDVLSNAGMTLAGEYSERSMFQCHVIYRKHQIDRAGTQHRPPQ